MASNKITHSALAAIRSREFTKAMQNLVGICTGIAADKHINELEVQFLSTWIANHPEIATAWPGSAVADKVREIMVDGIITADERMNLLEVIQELAGHDFENTGSADPSAPILPIDDDPSIFFRNMSFCFTGEFIGNYILDYLAILCHNAVMD